MNESLHESDVRRETATGHPTLACRPDSTVKIGNTLTLRLSMKLNSTK